MATKLLFRIFKSHNTRKNGFKLGTTYISDKKNPGDERLQTDDLILIDESDQSRTKYDLLQDKNSKCLAFSSTKDDKTLGIKSPNPGSSKFSPEEEKRKAKEERPKLDSPDVKENKTADLSDPDNPAVIVEKQFPPETRKVGSEKLPLPPANESMEETSKTKFYDILNNDDVLLNQEAVTSKPFIRNTIIYGGEEVEVLASPISLNKLRKISKSHVDGNTSSSFTRRSVSSDTSTEIDKKPKDSIPEGFPESESESDNKKPITDFNPNFIEPTADRRLNIGRTDSESKPENKKEAKPTYSYISNGSENVLSKFGKYDATENIFSPAKLSKENKTPDLIPENYKEMPSKNYKLGSEESIKSIQKAVQKQKELLQMGKLNERRIEPKAISIDALDPLSIPGYKPSLSEKPILPKDFIKFTEPISITSYDLVPGPSMLKAVGNLWKYIPLLGTQFVSTFIYTAQTFMASYDRKLKYPAMYPYYYLLNKYGPMVRLHGPIGANMLLLAVNGQDFPMVHRKIKGNKSQSFFDSLNC